MRRSVPLLLATAVTSAVMASPASAAPADGVTPGEACGTGFNPSQKEGYFELDETGDLAEQIGDIFTARNEAGDLCFYLVVNKSAKKSGTYSVNVEAYRSNGQNPDAVYMEVAGPEAEYDVTDGFAASAPVIMKVADGYLAARPVVHGTSDRTLDTTHTETRLETVAGTRDEVRTEKRNPSAATTSAAKTTYSKAKKTAATKYKASVASAAKKYKKAYGSKKYAKTAKYKKAVTRAKKTRDSKVAQAWRARDAAIAPNYVNVVVKVPTSDQVEVEYQVNAVQTKFTHGRNEFYVPLGTVQS
jgi:hypothetical protein